jgi:hypothetical protein
MPLITEVDKTYWMPDVIPQPTEEYQNEQSQKIYLTEQRQERMHPGWTYAETIAYVDDEYLFQNEGWKVVIDEKISEKPDQLKHVKRNTPNEWEHLNERLVKVTYTITDFTDEEVNDYINTKYEEIRNKRNILLLNTDWIIVRSSEEGLVVSQEVISYRKQLRDFPSTITDVINFKIDDDSLWPNKPNIYFVEE